MYIGLVAYNCNHAIRFQQSVEILKKLEGEQRNWLSATGEDIVHNIVELAICLVDELIGIGDSIGNDGRVIGRKLEVFCCKFMHHRVNFYHGGVNAMSNQGCGQGTNSKSTCRRISFHVSQGTRRLTHITRALASASRMGCGVSMSRTASSMVKIP